AFAVACKLAAAGHFSRRECYLLLMRDEYPSFSLD
ncbi:unnamed protein product, partial [marine sediment metagenome]